MKVIAYAFDRIDTNHIPQYSCFEVYDNNTYLKVGYIWEDQGNFYYRQAGIAVSSHSYSGLLEDMFWMVFKDLRCCIFMVWGHREINS
jgi:hypothetical protein